MNDQLNFHAGCVYAHEQDGVVTVGFADDEAAPQRYLLLQRTLVPSPRDVRLGQEGVYIERNDQGQSTYGGACSCILQKDRVRLELDAAAAVKTGGAHNLEVTFEVSAELLHSLREKMITLFKGQARFEDQTGKRKEDGDRFA